jgi:hypothetical protein
LFIFSFGYLAGSLATAYVLAPRPDIPAGY